MLPSLTERGIKMAIRLRSVRKKDPLKLYDIVFENTANSAGAAYQVIVPHKSKLRRIVISGTAISVSSVADILSVGGSSTLYSAVSLGPVAAIGTIVKAELTSETVIPEGTIISYSVSATAAVVQKVALILEKV
jgi:hypothetical protein